MLDSQDQLEKLEISLENFLENFKYSIFSQPTFKKLTISGVISKDSYFLYHATVLFVSLSSYIEV